MKKKRKKRNENKENTKKRFLRKEKIYFTFSPSSRFFPPTLLERNKVSSPPFHPRSDCFHLGFRSLLSIHPNVILFCTVVINLHNLPYCTYSQKHTHPNQPMLPPLVRSLLRLYACNWGFRTVPGKSSESQGVFLFFFVLKYQNSKMSRAIRQNTYLYFFNVSFIEIYPIRVTPFY